MSGFIGGPPAPAPAPGQPTCERIIRRPSTACGKVATEENGQTLCSRCRLDQDEAALPRDPLHNLDAIRRRHSVHQDAPPQRRRYPGEAFDILRWRTCRIEVLTFTLGEEGSGADTSFELLGHPWQYEQFPGMGGRCVVIRWRFYHPGKPGYLEATWEEHRRRGERLKRSFITYSPRASTKDAARLLGLWPQGPQDTPDPGKRGPRPRAPEDVLNKLAVSLARHCSDTDMAPAECDREVMATAAGYSPGALDNLMDLHKIHNADVISLADQLLEDDQLLETSWHQVLELDGTRPSIREGTQPDNRVRPKEQRHAPNTHPQRGRSRGPAQGGTP